MAPNLKGRLARIRDLGLVKAVDLAERGGGPLSAQRGSIRRDATIRRESPPFLHGWEAAGDMAWTRSMSYENQLPESIDPAVFAPLRRLAAAAPQAPARIGRENLRFFDLETTGLSGGTGTIAFLAAVGRFEDGDFTLTQVFLEDYPGEGAFLACLLPLLGGDTCIVSYNGKAFDLPLLRTRCVMNGLAPPEFRHHVDALFAARRLWKRVHGGASLGLLEHEVLGIQRGEDLPGALIPEVWLSFAREGQSPLMPLVLSHNALDVVGLARLLERAQAIFDDPRSRSGRSDLDRFGLGRTLLAAGRMGEGEELLEAAAADGDERAGLLLSLRCRRSRRVDDCLRVAAILPATFRCAVEKAKIFERTLGNLEEASLWAEEALRLASRDADRTAARARLGRIERKISRRG